MITLSRLRNLVPAIGDDDLMVAGGFVAIRPSLLPAVRAVVDNQVQYRRWLDQGYVLARVWVNPDQAVYVAAQSASDLSPSTIRIGEHMVPGPSVTTLASDAEIVTLKVIGGEAAEAAAALFTYMHTTYNYEMEGIQSWTLGCKVRESFRIPLGPEVLVTGKRVPGGFPGGEFISVSLARWAGEISTARACPATEVWPLIIGPAIFTRAEVYPFGEWCVVEAHHLADRLALAAEGIDNAPARAELAKQCAALKAQGKDLLGWAKFTQFDALDLMPETRGDASDIRNLATGDIDGIPLRDVMARLAKQKGVKVPIVVSYFDPLDYDFSQDLADIPKSLRLVVGASGSVANDMDPLAIQSIDYWLARVGSLRRVGVVVSVEVSADLVDVYLAEQARQLNAAAGSNAPSMDRYWSSTMGDRGAIGLGLWAAAVKPQRAETTELINVFTTPGFMDTLLPIAEG